MTKPTVTEEMVDAANKAGTQFWSNLSEPVMAEGFAKFCDDVMRAAITAALNASGLVERIAELEAFAAEVEVECNGHFNCDLTAEEALDNIRKQLEALNKEPTP